MTKEPVTVKRELCAPGGPLIPRLCVKCGVQVDVSAIHISEVRKNVYVCVEHAADVKAEVSKRFGMWPSGWFGHVRQQKYGTWLNLFEYTFEGDE